MDNVIFNSILWEIEARNLSELSKMTQLAIFGAEIQNHAVWLQKAMLLTPSPYYLLLF